MAANQFVKVPAVEKCFSILNLFARSQNALGITEISQRLRLNKSTVFNLVYTLKALEVLEQNSAGKFQFGIRMYLLGNASAKRSDLIQTVHPFLEKINQETKLSAFLGIRSGLRAVIIDKVDSAYDIKISSEIGMRLPLLAGAGGKTLLCQLDDDTIDRILKENPLKRFTKKTQVNRARFKAAVLKTRKEGVAFDDEGYIEGIVAFSVPLKTNRKDLQAAIWAVGLKKQVSTEAVPEIAVYLKNVAAEIGRQLSPELETGPGRDG